MQKGMSDLTERECFVSLLASHARKLDVIKLLPSYWFEPPPCTEVNRYVGGLFYVLPGVFCKRLSHLKKTSCENLRSQLKNPNLSCIIKSELSPLNASIRSYCLYLMLLTYRLFSCCQYSGECSTRCLSFLSYFFRGGLIDDGEKSSISGRMRILSLA